MMHSRGFVLSENQAFAGQTRTPGPSRLHASPTRKNMTTGKRPALGSSSNPFGHELSSVGPKQLAQDLMSSKSPVKALGDRNAAKTPGASKLAPGKGKGADHSPTKKGSSELSPRKASTSNALRCINGKQRQNTELPFTKPGQSSTNDAAGTMMKTPAPTQLGKARTMSRQNSLITPAANIGRAGQIKARMGEILDAEMGLSLQKADNATEQLTQEPVVQLTQEEMYPEIEYMPPSFHAKHPVFEFPDELDDLPRAKQLGAQLATFSTIGIRTAGPDDLSDVEITPMETEDGDELALSASTVESDDDDPWPDVTVTDEAAVPQRPAASRSTATSKGAATSTTARPSSTTRTVAAASAARAPLSGVRASVAASTSARPTVRPVQGKAPGQFSVRSTGLQRSIATVPGTRPALSSTSSMSRTASAARPTSATVRSGTRPAVSSSNATASRAPAPAPKGVPRAVEPAAKPLKRIVTTINPKLIDFVDDDLGRQTAAALDRLDAEEDMETLQLDLGVLSDEEA